MEKTSLITGLAVLLGLAGAVPAAAQYEGPGFAACMRYGEERLMGYDKGLRSVVFVSDRDTVIERYTENVGSQFVSSVLTGKATLEWNGGRSQLVRYICLLADENTPVFFHTIER